jgi:hypothetical protein
MKPELIEGQEKEDHGAELADKFNRALHDTFTDGMVSTRGVMIACAAIFEGYIGEIPDPNMRLTYLDEMYRHLIKQLKIPTEGKH